MLCRIPVNGVLHEGLMANGPSYLRNDTGTALAKMSGTFGVNWGMRKEGNVKCDIRSNGYNVEPIAVAYGGGGHATSAGFHVDMETLMSFIVK
jgi:nanoRNase/pAp phosphatase (c-di-AMP/oligoRNAs hydrolase)